MILNLEPIIKYINENIIINDWEFVYKVHNKKSVIDICKSFEEPSFKLGIQIEGNQYRYYLIAMRNEDSIDAYKIRENIAEKLYINGYWFNNTKDITRSHNYKNFCGYKPDFIYRYFILQNYFGKNKLEELEYNDIIQQIYRDINDVDANLSIIKKIVRENLRKAVICQ